MASSQATREQLWTFHRYFLWANRHRDDFLARAVSTGLPPTELADLRQWVRANFINCAPWLGSLYVLVEGWRDLKLSDPEIDQQLRSPHVESLRRFRNGVFHFQKKYFDDRFLAMFNEGGPQWAEELHNSFGRYFKAWLGSLGFNVDFTKDEGGNDIAVVTTTRHPSA